MFPPADIESNVPPAELYLAQDRVRVLEPLDNIVDHFYVALRGGCLIAPTLGYAMDFSYQVVSHYGPDQE